MKNNKLEIVIYTVTTFVILGVLCFVAYENYKCGLVGGTYVQTFFGFKCIK